MVLITTMVGYYMASGTTVDHPSWRRVLNTLIGTALTAAASGVLNQVIERDYDKLMPRTKNRPIPAGRVTRLEAAIYGIVLGVTGVTYLTLLVNPLTAATGPDHHRRISFRLHPDEKRGRR